MLSRGLIRSEAVVVDSRSHRYRAEDVRTLKERRTPSPEPRGMRSFDADLPVMDSAMATITEDGPIYRGVNCVDLAERDTLEHAATLLWDVSGRRPVRAGQLPRGVGRNAHRGRSRASGPMRSIAPSLCWRWQPVSTRGPSPAPPKERAMLGGRMARGLVVATMLNAKPSAKPLHLQIARVWAPRSASTRPTCSAGHWCCWPIMS